MKINLVKKSDKSTPSAVIAFDVSKNTLEFYSKLETPTEIWEVGDEVDNKILDIKECLLELKRRANNCGIDELTVVFEPTGGYEKKLSETASNLGFRVGYVASGHSKKANKLVSNDCEKSDEKDVRAIHLVAADINRITPVRNLSGIYKQLNCYNANLKRVNDRIIKLKNLIHHNLKFLVCDYEEDSDYIYGNVGRAIVRVTNMSPTKAVQMGRATFIRRVKKINPYAHQKKLKAIFAAFKRSLSCDRTFSDVEFIYVEELVELYDAWLKLDQKKESINRTMTELYQQTEEAEKLAGFEFSDKQMSKIIAETGPLKNFQTRNQLLQFAGLKLCRKESGSYKGKTKISKSGRTLLRHVLYQTVWANSKSETAVTARYYQQKKAEGKKHRVVAVAAMRKALKLILGVFKSQQNYQHDYLHELSA